MSARYTEKICPGCGISKSLPPNCVCGECSNAIRKFPELQARSGLLDAARLRQYNIGERTGIPSNLYSMNGARDFATAMSGLLKTVGQATPNKGKQGFHSNARPEPESLTMLEVEYRDRDSQDYIIHLPEGTTDALRPLYMSVVALVKEAEARGQQRGRQLLLQLNSGELSVADFNEAAIKNDSNIETIGGAK